MADQNEEYWDKIAGTFDEDQTYIVGEAVQEAIIQELSKEQDLGDVVEFGCGRGYYTRALTNNSKSIVATDLSDAMLDMGRNQLSEFRNITFQKANCKSTVFPAGTFDTAIMINLIHIIENPLDCLLECNRILKTGGKLSIVSFTGHSMALFSRIGMIFRFIRRWGKPLPYFNPALSPHQLAALLEKAAFTLEESKIIGDKSKALYVRAKKR
jgi:ubiquinone/menaquinone biosynthesis C-methylase UbiE